MKYTKAPVAQLPVSRQVETPACRQGASDFDQMVGSLSPSRCGKKRYPEGSLNEGLEKEVKR